ncbi:MAG: hypothetical protein BM555_04945 [Crocinitomix sp. MedPE-SWsnd]|nr:MAG: hypothetical protein BM555_04945 [Crocinitomix sp. MedPE-SWsnd]
MANDVDKLEKGCAMRVKRRIMRELETGNSRLESRARRQMGFRNRKLGLEDKWRSPCFVFRDEMTNGCLKLENRESG